MRKHDVWLILLLSVIPASIYGDGVGVALEAYVVSSEVALGEPLHLTVTLKNVSDESILLLVRDANFVVEMASASGMELIGSPRYTQGRSVFKDDEVPLRPGDAYTRLLPIPLNDLRAPFGEGWVGAAGVYRFRVRYDSNRSVQESSDHVWRGSADGNWLAVRLRSPDAKERARRLRDIETCIASDECNAVEVANFFRVVRDQRAPDLLLHLLESRPYIIWLLDAIVFQARTSDATRLRHLALKVDDPAIRQKFTDAAIKLEQSVPPARSSGKRKP